MAIKDLEHALRPAKKKGKKKKGNIKAVGAGLEGFVDWADPDANASTEKREDNMSSLAARFVE